MSKVYSLGLDTSKWQGSKVDYNLAKQKGYDFTFLRIGYNKTKDTCFEKDYAAAIAAGMKVGVYFYTLSTTLSEAMADASRVLGWLNNRHLDFPVAYDIEDSKQKNTTRKITNSNMYNTFANKLQENGVYDAILYTGESFFNNYFDKSLITDDVWIAKYSTSEPNIGRLVQMWQYTSAEVNEDFYVGKLDRNKLLTDRFQGSDEPIINISVNPYPIPTRTLKLTLVRMTGNDVKWLQWELGITIDGIFGPATQTAVKNYQKKKGLLVDGIVGSATRYSLQYD